MIEALRSGRFYGSPGPKIRDVTIEEASITVRCSPVRSVRVRSGPWDGCAVNADLGMGNWRGEARERDADGLITGARFEFPEFWRWARVEVEDERGRRAWSNPFGLPGETASAVLRPAGVGIRGCRSSGPPLPARSADRGGGR